MLTISFSKVHEAQLEQLRAWGRELTSRADEVKETYRQEGVSHEASYLIETKTGWILVFAAEVEDRERARAVYRASTLPIDIEHRQVMQVALEGGFEAELLYECRV
jgi:Family of unknown function (DUF6176)